VVRRLPFNADIELLNILIPSENRLDPELPRTVASQDVTVKGPYVSELKKAPNSADVYIASRIRTRRMLIGLSQEKLGQALGVTFQQVQKYERGANRVSAGRLQSIGAVLGVRPLTFTRGFHTKIHEVMVRRILPSMC
jgi:DNA-binding transcriptional regulator YiaG